MPRRGMQAVVLGSGSALPDPDRGNPSHAVIVDGEVLLFDCGERATVNLVRAGVNPMDVGELFFTHLHWDHVVDYGYFLMSTWNCGRSALDVYGPPGTRAMCDHVLAAHAVDVEFVTRFVATLPPHITARPPASPGVRVTEIVEGTIVEREALTVAAREVMHLNLLGFEHSSFGYRVDSRYGSVVISGDTEPCDALVELAAGADLLIHECTFLEDVIAAREMRGHSGPRGAGRIAQRAGVGRLVLTHLGPYDALPPAVDMASIYYGPRRGPAVWSTIVRDAAAEFDGPIELGHDAMVIHIGE